MYNIENLLEIGLFSLATSSKEEKWFPGHISASIVAIALFLKENNVDNKIKEAALLKVNEIIKNNSVIYENIYSEEQEPLYPIVEAININIKHFSADGHGIIYGALALKAINILNKNIKQNIIEGIARIIHYAQQDNLSRYWSIENYKEAVVNFDSINDFKDVYEAAVYCLKNQKNLLGNLDINGKKYYFEGSKLHEITHVHSLILLDQLGYGKMAQEGLIGLRKQIFFNKHQPNLEPEKADTFFDPLNLEFWQYPIKDYHHFKLAYSLFSLFKILNIQDSTDILKDASVHWKILNK